MKARYMLLIFFAVTIISCRKHHIEHSVPPPVSSDKPVLKLKDMIENRLPSPYYHFEYSDSGYITKAAFASGLSFYDLTYTGNKVSEMAMNKNTPFDIRKDKLEYDYDNGNLTGVRVIDKNGVYYRRCLLTFSPSRQLQKLEWDVKPDIAGFVKEETLQFSYHADGNLAKINYQSYAVAPQTASTSQDEFEDYDDGLNADGFSLLHINPYFLDLLLLPSVNLQLNNPRRVTHTGDGDGYQIKYSYTYDPKARPLEKRGDFLFTTGPNAGTHVNLLTTFSYYN